MKDQRYEFFQKTLADARQKKGLTQAEIAIRLRKPQSYVSKYESGERRIDIIEFLDVCEALGINPITFLRKILAHE